MNEINNQKIFYDALIALIFISIICGFVFYIGTAGQKLENELNKLERLNSQLASETIQLRNELEGHQQRIGSITTGIKDVTNEIGTVSSRIGKSQQGVRNLYTEIKETGTDLERAECIIEECEEILKEITKTK